MFLVLDLHFKAYKCLHLKNSEIKEELHRFVIMLLSRIFPMSFKDVANKMLLLDWRREKQKLEGRRWENVKKWFIKGKESEYRRERGKRERAVQIYGRWVMWKYSIVFFQAYCFNNNSFTSFKVTDRRLWMHVIMNKYETKYSNLRKQMITEKYLFCFKHNPWNCKGIDPCELKKIIQKLF